MIVRNMRALVVLPIILLCLAACDTGDKGDQAPTNDIDTATLPDAVYSGIYETPIQLTAGKYEGEPFEEGGYVRPRVELVRGAVRSGNLNDQSGLDAAVLLEENSGGTGHFLYVAALAMREGKAVNVATSWIGDRIDIRAFSIEDRQIILDVVEQGESDAACCPTQLATYRFSLEGDSLKVAEHVITGTLSLEIISDIEWHLTGFDLDDPLTDSITITLVIDSGRISGSTGCNRYHSTVEEVSRPGAISIGPIGATRKACPPPLQDIEIKYLACLGAASQYSFYVEELAIFWVRDDTTGTLLFTRVPAQ